jgi:hypothetical protein
MRSCPVTGYYVRPRELRRKAAVYGEFERNAQEARDELRAAFDRDKNTLGNDEYGAELAKKMPEIERGIFDALRAYIDELGRIASDLHVNARNYERAERPPTGDS